jgi:hypothetical protein
VIRGNSLLFKCSIPPFVADFVNVISWIDDAGNNYYINESGATDYGTKGFNYTQMFESKFVILFNIP